MKTYALLGATGQVGGSILTVLLKKPEIKIRVYVRSRSRLLKARPELESTPNVTIHEGTLDDSEAFTNMVAGAQVLFLTAGAPDNIPGVDVAQLQVKRAVEALTQLRKQGAHVPLPRVILLSAAPLEPAWMKDTPRIGIWILNTALSNIYADLRLAEDYLRAYPWIDQVYVKPAGLVHDRPHGHAVTTDRQHSFLSFLDLAAGFVEVADADDARWSMQSVSVVPAAPGTKFNRAAPYHLIRGLLWHYFPNLYPSWSRWLP